jgi:hypothetical protein
VAPATMIGMSTESRTSYTERGGDAGVTVVGVIVAVIGVGSMTGAVGVVLDCACARPVANVNALAVITASSFHDPRMFMTSSRYTLMHRYGLAIHAEQHRALRLGRAREERGQTFKARPRVREVLRGERGAVGLRVELEVALAQPRLGHLRERCGGLRDLGGLDEARRVVVADVERRTTEDRIRYAPALYGLARITVGGSRSRVRRSSSRRSSASPASRRRRDRRSRARARRIGSTKGG